MKPTALFPAHGYVAATRALLKNTYDVVQPANSPVTSDSNNFIGAIVNDITREVRKYCHLIKSDTHCAIWQKSSANKLGRLFQGICNIKGMDTCFFIRKNQMPRHKRATYSCICCNYWPQKDEPHCTQLTVGGNSITYASNKSTPIADLVTAMLLINSTISTPNAKFYRMDLLNFYLMTPMKEYQYMHFCLDLIPNKIVQKYKLHDLVDDQGWVYVKIRMGMYGLPQAGILANKLLKQRLNAKGYYHCQHTLGLWCHLWHDIIFCLVVDDFGIKTTSREHVLDLKTALEEHYTFAMDWNGSLFCSINIDWNYPASIVDLNMPKYIPKALLKFQHLMPDSPQHQPYKNAPIQYGARIQRVDINTSAPLSPDAIKCIQDTIGTLLYYRRAINPTLLTALSSIAAQQANGTTAVTAACQQLLNYVTTHPNARIRYKACDMILAIHTDASYLSKQAGKSHTSCFVWRSG